MTKDRTGRLSRRTVEHLLDGRGGDEPLAELLAAAAVPAHADELTGEHQALAQFRAAVPVTPVPPRRRSMIETVLAKLLAAKVLAAVAAASVATGGVALAATTGSLPAPLQSAAHDAFGAPAPEGPSAGHADESGRAGTPSPTSTLLASPSPASVGVCQAFRAAAERDAGKALDNPTFGVLVTEAGGRDRVTGYCATLTGAPRNHPGATPTDRPAPQPTGTPGADATDAPADHPGARPTPTGGDDGYPSGKPTSRPTAYPTARPTSYPTGWPTAYPTGRATGFPLPTSITAPRGR